jgi:hypothetical protein
VGVAPHPGELADLETAIVRVRRIAVDGEVAERVTGAVLAIDPPRRALRASLPVLAG